MPASSLPPGKTASDVEAPSPARLPDAPVTRSADRTRAGLLEAATAEFVAHGLSGASVNEIGGGRGPTSG